MLKRDIKEIFKNWNPKIIDIFKSLFVIKRGADGFYYERDQYDRIYCVNHLHETLRLIADVKTEILKNYIIQGVNKHE